MDLFASSELDTGVVSVPVKLTCLKGDVEVETSSCLVVGAPGSNLLADSETAVPPLRPSNRVIKLNVLLGPPT